MTHAPNPAGATRPVFGATATCGLVTYESEKEQGERGSCERPHRHRHHYVGGGNIYIYTYKYI